MSEAQFVCIVSAVWAVFFMQDGFRKLAIFQFFVSVVVYFWVVK